MNSISQQFLDVLRSSELFDENWYLEQYPDVKILGMDPIEHYLWVGAKIGRDPSAKFDSSAYLDLYKDVAQAGINPLAHYLRWGRQEGRQVSKSHLPPLKGRSTPKPPRSIGNNEQLRALWVTTPHDKMTQQYRVRNVIEALVAHNVRSEVCQQSDLTSQMLDEVDVLILNRTPANDALVSIIRKFSESGCPVIYDIDDMIFSPEDMQYLRAVSARPPERQKEFRRMMEGQRRTLLNSTIVTTSTFALKRRVEALGKPALVIPNNISLSHLERADELIRAARQRKAERVRLGYFSGTATHEHDFAECEEAIFELMSERDDIEFIVVGHLEKAARFEQFGERFIKIGLVNHDKMVEHLSTVHINLAPLELGNRFVDCKSELKIFEAALLEIPTIASPSASYGSVIIHGRNGFLAQGRDQWRECLVSLLGDPEARIAIGQEAGHSIAGRFSVVRVASELNTAIRSVHSGRSRAFVPTDAKPQAIGQKPVASVISILYKKREEVVYFLETMRRQNFDQPYEIILVDDVSPDDSVETVEMFVRDRAGLPDSNPLMSVRILRNEQNIGNCSSRNKGVAEASGDIIFVVDADCLFNEDWLAAHYRAHERGLCDVAIGPKGIETNGEPPMSVLGRHEADPALAVKEANPQDGINQDSFVNCVTRNFSVRKDFVDEALGGTLFDDEFNYSAHPDSGFGWEDVEMGCRLFAAGARIKFLADTVSIHVSHPPSVENSDKPYRSLKNFRRLHEKHPDLYLQSRAWTQRTFEAIVKWCKKVGGDLDGNIDYLFLKKHFGETPAAPAIINKSSRNLRVLTYRWHCPHQYELYRLGHQFTLARGLGSSLCEDWDWRSRPMPSNAAFASFAEIDPSSFDLAILHFDENVLHPEICNGLVPKDWGRTFLGLLNTINIPKIAICHGTPQFYGQYDHNYDGDNFGAVIEANRKQLVELLKDTVVVCNSHQAQREWQFQRSRVIWQGFAPHEFPLGARGGGIVSMAERAMRNRPLYNGYFVMKEFRELLAGHADIHHLSVDDPPSSYLPRTNEWAKAKYENYVRELGRYDIYVNPTVRSPMPRTRGEAMMTGAVTVSLRNHDADMFIKSGTNGFVADGPEEMAEQVKYLLRNPSSLESMSRESRLTALDAFNQDRYLAEWRGLISEVVGSK